ncbi:hypothetical protein [Confluentibacter sediminis]|uniref:hypothetical protein n=1 Tax=Confluentibacter sediminis TaxID=2219045 RepID=UPI000DAC9F3A|nr:hypothetical protein [Confluentibacter sediminis]
MKVLKFTIVTMFVLLTATSCKNEKKESTTEKSQMQEVLAVHDEIMPKMGTIGNLISQIDVKIKETDSTEVLVNASRDLKDSHKDMMDWMKDFGEYFDSDEILNGKELSSEKQKTLDEQEAKIKTLRDKMNSSITNAQNLLK